GGAPSSPHLFAAPGFRYRRNEPCAAGSAPRTFRTRERQRAGAERGPMVVHAGERHSAGGPKVAGRSGARGARGPPQDGQPQPYVSRRRQADTGCRGSTLTEPRRPELPTAERIKVMVADDEESVRDVLEALLSSEPEIELIGKAADAEAAIELACSKLPDVALVDVHMPGGGGPRATREILRRSPPTRVVALSAHEDVSTVLTMLRAGAVGYVVKGESTDQILSAIHRTVQGKSSVPERLAAPVAAAMVEHVQEI